MILPLNSEDEVFYVGSVLAHLMDKYQVESVPRSSMDSLMEIMRNDMAIPGFNLEASIDNVVQRWFEKSPQIIPKHMVH